MRHDFIDKYSRGNSLVHRLDARVKVLTALMVIVGAITAPGERLTVFILLGLVPVVVCSVSRVPLAHLFTKALIVVPFLLLLSPFLLLPAEGGQTVRVDIGLTALSLSRDGLGQLVEIASKTLVTVFTTITLMATTSFDKLLRGLQGMRCPRVVIALLSFMYRYVFLLIDEGERMIVARKSRSIRMSFRRSLRSIGHLASALFFRTFERGERIYSAMQSRGFTGEVRTLDVPRLMITDVVALLLVAVYVLGVRWLGGVYG